MTEIEITLGHEKDMELFGQLATNIRAFNQSVIGDLKLQTVTAVARDEGAELIGGLYAEFVSGWLLIHAVWVAESHRRRGIGRRLMEKMEQFAEANAAVGSQVDTTSYQAPEFYAQFGFQEFGRLEDYLDGHSRIYLSKRYTW